MKISKRLARALAGVVLWPLAFGALLARLIIGDIFDDIGGWLGGGLSGIWDAVKSFVVRMFRHFVNFLSSTISWVSDALWAGISWVAASAYALVQGVAAALSWWVGVLWGAIKAVEDGARWLVDVAVSGLKALIGVVWDALTTVYDTLRGALDDVFTWVIQHVWNPLNDAINSVINFIGDHVIPFFNGLINNLWCFVSDLAQSIGSIASGVFNDLIGPFKTVLAVALEALKWLVYFATHPFDWFVHLFDDFFVHGSKWLFAKVAGAVQSNMETVDHWLSRFFE